MSHEFVQAKGYNLQDNKDSSEEGRMVLTFLEDESEIDKNHIALFAPNVTSDYNKAIIECAINLLNNFVVDNKLFNQSKNNPFINQNGIDIDLIICIKQISDALQYLINSNSWCSSIPKPYDVREVCNKLDLAKLVLTQTLKRK